MNDQVVFDKYYYMFKFYNVNNQLFMSKQFHIVILLQNVHQNGKYEHDMWIWTQPVNLEIHYVYSKVFLSVECKIAIRSFHNLKFVSVKYN